MLRQSTFPRGGRLNRLRTRCHLGALVEKSPATEMLPAHPCQPARPRWLTVEKSPARETGIIAHLYPNTRPWRLVTVAISRKGNVGNAPAPARSPSVAHRREIPRVRNVNNRTPLPEYTPAVARRHTRAPHPVAYYRKNTTARKNGSLIRVTVSLFLIRCGRRRLRGAPERRGERITRRPRSSLPF